jgi:ABC-type Mn2+/Zn2+ transport system ATPase subunit
MKVVSARLGPYKSINKPTELTIDDRVTILVGINESGKSAILEALFKSRPVTGSVKFDHLRDYPKKDRINYKPEKAVSEITYELDKADTDYVSKELGVALPANVRFTLSTKYGDTRNVLGFPDIDEAPRIKTLLLSSGLSEEVQERLNRLRKNAADRSRFSRAFAISSDQVSSKL